MKKLFFIPCLLFCCSILWGQHVDRTFIKAGFHAGMPLGDAENFSNFTLGFDFYYHVGLSKVFDTGFTSGFTNAFGKTEEVQVGDFSIAGDFNNLQFVPVAAMFRYYPALRFNLGGDVGYALALNEGLGGGLYYRPTVNFDISDNSGLYFSYTAIQLEDLTWSTVTAGLMFQF